MKAQASFLFKQSPGKLDVCMQTSQLSSHDNFQNILSLCSSSSCGEAWLEMTRRHLLNTVVGCTCKLFSCFRVERHMAFYWSILHLLQPCNAQVHYCVFILTAFEHEMCVQNCSLGHFNNISTFFSQGQSIFCFLCCCCCFFWGGGGGIGCSRARKGCVCLSWILAYYNYIENRFQPCLSSSVIGCAMTLDKQSIHILLSFSVIAFKTKSRPGVTKMKQQSSS